MKSAKIKERLKAATAAVVAVGLFGGLLLGLNNLTLNAAINEETYAPPATEYVSIPENPVYNEDQPVALTVIDMAWEEADPLALSMEEAAQIGAQYIYDVFGVCIDGMYVEMGFAPPRWATRSVWRGEVSVQNRNTRERMDYANERLEEILRENPYALEWSSGVEDCGNFVDLSGLFEYIPANFYFSIDAITGERIDVWNNDLQMRGHTSEDMIAARLAFIELYEQGYNLRDVEVSDEEKNELVQIAMNYGQIQFVNTTVADVDFMSATNDITLDENGELVIIPGFALFDVTDDTGRVARITICRETLLAVSINTMQNDMLPFDELPEGTFIRIYGDDEDAVYHRYTVVR